MQPSTSVTGKSASLLPISADNGTARAADPGAGQPATFANMLQRHAAAEPARPATPQPDPCAAHQQQAQQQAQQAREREAERSSEAARERQPAGPRARDTKDTRPAAAGQRPTARQPQKADPAESADASGKAQAKDDETGEAALTDPAAAAGANGWFAALAAARPAGAAQAAAAPQGGEAADKADPSRAPAAAVEAAALAGADAAAAPAVAGDATPGPRPAAGGAEPGAAAKAALALDDRGGQSAKEAATGTDAVHMLGAAGDAAQEGGQAAGGAQSFESALLAAQSAHQAGGTHATRQSEPVAGHVETPVGTPGFADALGEQVRMLVTQAAGRGENTTLHEAKLSLNPAELGPITIRIALDGQQAQVEFTAASETTRRAIEDSLPQLAGALQGEGLTLTGGGVYDQRQQPGEPGRGGEGAAGRGHATTVSLNAPAGLNDGLAGAAPAGRRSQGAVDLYA